jgi:hypothetical protein
MREMVGGCCVCSDDRGWSENPLVYCDGQSCTVAVHQGNYTPFHKSHIEFNFFVLKVNKNHPKTGQMVISVVFRNLIWCDAKINAKWNHHSTTTTKRDWLINKLKAHSGSLISI